jgi:chromosome segregation ATPase
MNTETLSALKQVNSLISQLQDALKDPSLTPDEKKLLRQAVNDQMDLQDTLIQDTMQAMVDKINAANADLQQLTAKMESTSQKLARLATAIKKVSDVVGTLGEITAKAISAGLLGGA